ncbi:hypothetical protein CEXT_511991 [Caerostris extrusa]|uniref:Uncharacterized protein n=1 Tax=Caerostris extrusa TaxID=172846 RepID=A0AAV4XKP7_CAEEX|nr:hypothetical protein CEXT_511991 [Caerostris extrusa]
MADFHEQIVKSIPELVKKTELMGVMTMMAIIWRRVTNPIDGKGRQTQKDEKEMADFHEQIIKSIPELVKKTELMVVMMMIAIILGGGDKRVETILHALELED